MEFTDVWRDWARFVFFGNSAESAEWTNDVLRARLTASWDAFSRREVDPSTLPPIVEEQHLRLFAKCPRCGYQSPVAAQEELTNHD